MRHFLKLGGHNYAQYLSIGPRFFPFCLKEKNNFFQIFFRDRFLSFSFSKFLYEMRMIGHKNCCQTIDRLQLLQRHSKEAVRLLNSFRFNSVRDFLLFSVSPFFCLFLFCHYFVFVNIKHENIHETTSIEIVLKNIKFKVNREKKKFKTG